MRSVVVIGTGLIGSAFIDSLNGSSRFQVTVAFDSKGGKDLISNKHFKSISESLQAYPDAVIVDCTASEEIPREYEYFLANRHPVITCNKKGLVKDIDVFNKRMFRYESTVGAGVPIIATLRDIVDSGDVVLKIEAIASGTLAFLFDSISKGISVDECIKSALHQGLCEPDPRQDLNGMDVYRKAVIMAKTIGWTDISGIEPYDLVPPHMAHLNLRDFLQSMSEIVIEKGKQYMIVIDNVAKSIQIGPQPSPSWIPVPSMNVFRISTNRFPQGLILAGAGAGPDPTISGLHFDLNKYAY